MMGAPVCPPEIERLLDKKPTQNNAKCPICNRPLNINDFGKAKWGKALIEMCHVLPLSEHKVMHNYENMSWAHRECNIAQGEKSIPEFLVWISDILKAHGYTVSKKKTSYLQISRISLLFFLNSIFEWIISLTSSDNLFLISLSRGNGKSISPKRFPNVDIVA